MSAVGNMKMTAGAMSNSIDSITTIASVAALNIPDDGSTFYVSGTTTITSITGTTVFPGREITLASSTGNIALTRTAIGSFPGSSGNFFTAGAITLGKGDTITFRQLETGAWAQVGQSNNS
jgi:hypothetical protein